jgi:hypothetical protein
LQPSVTATTLLHCYHHQIIIPNILGFSYFSATSAPQIFEAGQPSLPDQINTLAALN